MRPAVLLAAMAIAGLGCAAGAERGDAASRAPRTEPTEPTAAVVAAPRLLGVRIEAAYPHDPEAWTQGLEWYQGRLYESVGRYGRSALRRVDLESGQVLEESPLPFHLFAEGLTRVGRELMLLTWRAGRGFRFDLDSLEPIGEFTYDGEGWGLCAVGGMVIRSDGTDRLHSHRPEDFARIRSVAVTRAGVPVGALNELECVDGWVYANVYQTDEIVRIDPTSGQVSATIDASGLLTPEEREGRDVLNGIAYYPPRRSFLLTGKLWPRLFEVSFFEADR